MLPFFLRRVFQALVILFLVSFVSYALMGLMPGDPVEEMIAANPRITQADISRLREFYGVDVPLHTRYMHWLSDTLQGDMGYSRVYKVPVMSLLGERLLNTFVLSITSLAIAVCVAVPLGVLSAVKHNSKLDGLVSFVAFAGHSVPVFWLGILAIYLFSVWIPQATGLRLLPAGGTHSIGDAMTNSEAFVDRIRYLILPVGVLAFTRMATFVRFTRSAMLDVLRQDYLRTARAKGLRESVVIFRHGLRNGIIPIVTLIALSLGGAFSGAIITEQVFAYQGVGKLVYDAVLSSDFNLAMVSFNITIAFVLLMNLLADLSYGALDPRISYK